MKVTAKTTVKDHGLKEILKSYKRLNGVEVACGILPSVAAKRYANGNSLVKVAAMSEFGGVVRNSKAKQKSTANKVGYLGSSNIDQRIHDKGLSRRLPSEAEIPERPFLRPAFDANKDAYFSYIKKIVAKPEVYLKDKRRALAVMGNLAKFMKRDVLTVLNTGAFAPNAPLTVAIKGHGQPLMDTGTLYSSIDAKVRIRRRKV